MSDQELIDEIIDSWKTGRNALLYGPPGTGKTRILSELWARLQDAGTAATGPIGYNPDPHLPLKRPGPDLGIPTPAKAVWVTFHQSYAYEDFVLGLRPEARLIAVGQQDATAEHAVTDLKPWMGVLLDAVAELNDEASDYESVVIFIDEINRGNAARIFGEMLTFLDFDYREEGAHALPVPLRQLRYLGDQSEPIYRIGGEQTTLPVGLTFPKHIYLVATMNSVDRAAVPIDSALARRFDRIEMRPDLSVLSALWQVDLAKLQADESTWEKLSAYETAILVLDQLNSLINSDFGAEFELGHGMLLATMTKDVDEPWHALATAWDDVLYPQLEDRYAGNPGRLMEVLKVDAPPATGDYAWQPRRTLTGKTHPSAMRPVKLSKTDADVAKRSLQWLALDR